MPDSPDVIQEYQDGVRDFEAGNLDAAEATFRAFVDRHPGSDLADNALYQLGMILAMTDRKPEALDVFQRCVSAYAGTDAAPLAASQAASLKDEMSTGGEDEARRLFHQGRDLASKRNFDAAKKVFLECVERFPDSSLADNVYLSLSMVFSLEGHFAEARRMLELILERFPDSDAAATVPAALRRLELDEKYQ